MPVAGYVTPCRTETFQNLQLNAGAFLMNFDYATYNEAGTLREELASALSDPTMVLGATRGGGTFVVNSEIREPEVDGKRYRFKGGAFVDSVDAQLTGTLVEIRPEVFARILATGEATTSGSKTTVKMHTAIRDSDYIDSLVWIGDMSDGGLVLIAMKNALNNSGVTLTFTDKGEGTLPFEFHAYQENVEDYDYAPFEVIFLGTSGASVSVSPGMAEVAVDGTLNMTYYGKPEGGTVAWDSDDTDIATVSNKGVVTGVAAGTVTITATYTPTSGSAVTGKAVVRVVST